MSTIVSEKSVDQFAGNGAGALPPSPITADVSTRFSPSKTLVVNAGSPQRSDSLKPVRLLDTMELRLALVEEQQQHAITKNQLIEEIAAHKRTVVRMSETNEMLARERKLAGELKQQTALEMENLRKAVEEVAESTTRHQSERRAAELVEFKLKQTLELLTSEKQLAQRALEREKELSTSHAEALTEHTKCKPALDGVLRDLERTKSALRDVIQEIFDANAEASELQSAVEFHERRNRLLVDRLATADSRIREMEQEVLDAQKATFKVEEENTHLRHRMKSLENQLYMSGVKIRDLESTPRAEPRSAIADRSTAVLDRATPSRASPTRVRAPRDAPIPAVPLERMAANVSRASSESDLLPAAHEDRSALMQDARTRASTDTEGAAGRGGQTREVGPSDDFVDALERALNATFAKPLPDRRALVDALAGFDQPSPVTGKLFTGYTREVQLAVRIANAFKWCKLDPPAQPKLVALIKETPALKQEPLTRQL